MCGLSILNSQRKEKPGAVQTMRVRERVMGTERDRKSE